MQNHQEKIERLLFELSCCVNELQAARSHVTCDDIQQAELSFHKLESFIHYTKLVLKSKAA